MSRLFRVFDWPLRAKWVLLFVVASLVPLGIATGLNIDQARKRLLKHTLELLGARGDQIRAEFDAFLRGYTQAVDELADLPDMRDYCESAPETLPDISHEVLEILKIWPKRDANVHAVAILDMTGRVRISSQEALIGCDLSYQPHVRVVTAGVTTISEMHVAPRELDSVPVVTYLSPILNEQRQQIGSLALWVEATALWNFLKRANGLAGPGSFGVLVDHRGIRIAHTFRDDLVFKPAGQLDAETIDVLVKAQRFGAQTRAYLEDVEPFEEIFERSRAEHMDGQPFRGMAPANGKVNLAVGRDLEALPWSIFYLVPEAVLQAEISRMMVSKTSYAVVILFLALIGGWLVAILMLRPIWALSDATRALASGDLAARVQHAHAHADELGMLSASFNTMAERIETQAVALQAARDDLELRVAERTKALEAENSERKRIELRLSAQLERLNLLNQITQAIGERQDLKSIFQVVIRSLEDDLSVDFGCICLYDMAAKVLTVTSVGARSEELALDLALTEQSRIVIDQNGLSVCVQGRLVYEPDIQGVAFPFPERLARSGLRAMVAAPLLVESQVFGAVIVARKEPDSFSSTDCEFIRQLSAHTALASHQAQLYSALQAAYDDLRLTQQAVMQQERLRVLGQMASGIAHDINNALTPVMMYAEHLIETERELTPPGREALVIIQRAVEDIAQTVARMGEFYRQRDRQIKLHPVRLNELAHQVIDLTRARWSDMAQQRGAVIDINYALDANLPLVMGIESEIREALTNLVLNAIDSMSQGGALTLRTRTMVAGSEERTGPCVVIEVIDTGAGMSEEVRRRCMEPFFTTKGTRGTGLGLAMVYGVVERHNGEVEIESKPGEGTLIRLIFHQGVDSAVERAAPSSQQPMQGQRLLIVDDDPVLLKALRDILEAEGHDVIAASGGQAGIDLFLEAHKTSKPFNIVITDLGMPNVDGRSVGSAIKQASPKTPVILLTGWGQRMMEDGETPLNIDLVLGKPPKRNDLRQALLRCANAARTDDPA